MPTSDKSRPRLRAGFWTWAFQGENSHVFFVGKGPRGERQGAFAEVVADPAVRLAWPRQVHSDIVVEASRQGPCGQADALTTAERGLAVSVATADCVPIVVEAPRHLATIHAGWRGLAGHIIQQTLQELGDDPRRLQAWIGPAIGPCCYEVGRDVANKVVAASDRAVLIETEPRPHLDLVRAARAQLLRGGVEQIHSLSVCTHCSPEWLWSYRRDRDDAGRNWAFAWRE